MIHLEGLFLHVRSGKILELCLTELCPSVAAEGARPLATVTPSVLNVYQGQRAEFHCTVTGNPTPAIEWIGMISWISFLIYLMQGLLSYF